MENKVDFKKLIEEYDNTVNGVSIEKLQNDNKILDIDIKGIEKDISRKESDKEVLNKRKEEFENSSFAVEYPDVVKDMEAKIQEVSDYIESRKSKISKMSDQKTANNQAIDKVNNIAEDVKKRAENQTESVNKDIEAQISELVSEKENYGIKINKDGKTKVQLTAEEKVVCERLDKKITELKQRIANNNRKLKLFKRNIDLREEKRLSNTLENKKVEEPKVEEPKVEEPKVVQPKVAESKVKEPKVVQPKVEKPKATEPKVTESKVKWPDYLTQEQILDAKSRDIFEPKGQEYEQYLKELGIKTEVKKTAEPKVAQPKAEEPKVAKPEETKDAKRIELKNVKITICPISNSIILEAKDQNGKPAPYITQDLDYSEEFMNSDEIKLIINKVQEQFNYELYDFEKLDPNILIMLSRTGCIKELLEYVASIDSGSENKSISSFAINYDLKDMYSSDMLYNEEKTKISKLAKVAKSIGADVSKDNILKRMSGKIKSLLSKNTRKKLVENNKADYAYEKAESSAREKFLKEISSKAREEGKVLTKAQEETVRGEYFDETHEYKTGKGFVPKESITYKKSEPEQKIQKGVEAPQEDLDSIIEEVNSFEDDKTSSAGSVDRIIREVHSWEEEKEQATEEQLEPKKSSKLISKAKSMGASFGRGIKHFITEAKVAGIRRRGEKYGLDEDLIGTCVQAERKSFIPQATVNHTVAQEAAKSKAEGQKVIIEHPDGSKEEGTRL